MMRYETTAGAAGSAPVQWPQESGLARQAGLPTLVMAAHPQCPCTRASIEELAALMTGIEGRLTAHLVFLRPSGTQESWTKTATWRAAAGIPGVTASVDREGLEARRFGGETSGDVLLYSASGELVFHGGITAARGHAGENDGRAALASLLAGKASARSRTPVFGCPLSNPKSSIALLP